MTKREQSPLAGKQVTVKDGVKTLGGQSVLVVDWVDNACETLTPAFLEVFMNRISEDIKIDMTAPDELRDVLLVLHGGTSAALVHINELDVPEAEKPAGQTLIEAARDFCQTWAEKMSKDESLLLIASNETGLEGAALGTGNNIVRSIATTTVKQPIVGELVSRGLIEGKLHSILTK